MEKLLKAIKDTGMRKVFLSMFMFVCLCVLVWFHRMTDALFADCVKIIIGSVCLSNAAEHLKGKKDDANTTTSVV